jgi:hypothetical protein
MQGSYVTARRRVASFQRNGQTHNFLSNFICPYLRKCRTPDWGMFDYFDLQWFKEHSLQILQETAGTLCTT